LAIASVLFGAGCTMTEDDGGTAIGGTAPINTVKPQDPMECMDIPSVDRKSMCLVLAAESMNEPKVCELIDDREWKMVCYKELGEDALAQALTTTTSTTTTSTTTTSTSTTTTIVCGNGRIDWGEQCDIGLLCEHADGVCSYREMNSRAICLYNSTCDWNTEVSTVGMDFDMGRCNGCYGPNMTEECRCIETPKWNETTTSTMPRWWHWGCKDGKCEVTNGEGPDECLKNSHCFHWECENKECKIVKDPGNSTCSTNIDCITLWNIYHDQI